jgi:hypothetical protein
MRKIEAKRRAPGPKINIAEVPFTEFTPTKKLFKPKHIPARKLGAIRNFFTF